MLTVFHTSINYDLLGSWGSIQMAPSLGLKSRIHLGALKSAVENSFYFPHFEIRKISSLPLKLTQILTICFNYGSDLIFICSL